jgi:hypothetical protein
MAATVNPIERTWTKIDLALTNLKNDRLKLGKLFLDLQELYSNKSADVRRIGVGCWEKELANRNLSPRTVREWISDYKIQQSREKGTSAGQTSSEKRKAIRDAKANSQSQSQITEEQIHLAQFAYMIPLVVAEMCYEIMTKDIYRDNPGAIAKLRGGWSRVKPVYERIEAALQRGVELGYCNADGPAVPEWVTPQITEITSEPITVN